MKASFVLLCFEKHPLKETVSIIVSTIIIVLELEETSSLEYKKYIDRRYCN